MNRFYFHRAALGVMLGVMALGPSACDFDAAKEAFTNAKLILGLENQKTTVGVSFVDAGTGLLLGGTFPVTLTGPDAASVVDAYGDPLTKRTARSGLTTFAISNTRRPTRSAPISVRVSALPSGYLPLSQNVVLTDTGAVSISVRAVRPAAPGQGTQSAQQANTAGAGGTATPISVATPATPPAAGGAAPPRASLASATGSTLRGSSNQALTGPVTTTLLSIDPRQREAMALVPGGICGAGAWKDRRRREDRRGLGLH